jgi:hypothetical protein
MPFITTPWLQITLWDILLFVAISGMGVVIASLHDPRWKALMLSLPIPFTISFLSVGRPLDATNVTALNLLLGYTYSVYGLHRGLRVPIVPAIFLSAGGYCALAGVLARVMPRTPAAFWLACAGTVALAATLHACVPPRDEPGHRNPLPLPARSAAIGGVVIVLVLLKGVIQGFMTVFPMVGVLASYEARHSLWTNCRQIPIIMLTLTPMMIAINLAQGALRWPVAGALALGWAVLFATLLPITRDVWTASPLQEDAVPARN